MYDPPVVLKIQAKMLKAFCRASRRNRSRERTTPEREHIRRAVELIFFELPLEDQYKWVEEMIEKGYFNPFDYDECKEEVESAKRDYSNKTESQQSNANTDYSTPTTSQQPRPKSRAFTKQGGLLLGSALKTREKGGKCRKKVNKS